MRKHLNQIFLLLAILLVVGIFLILRMLFPKNADTLPFFLILMLADLYLWIPIRRFLLYMPRLVRITTGILYWLPMILLTALLVYLLYIPIRSAGIALRTYWLGLIFIGYSAKLVPITFLLIADLIRLIKFVILKIFNPERAKGTKARRSNIIIAVGSVLGTIQLIVFLIGMFYWAYDFRVIKQDINLPELPASFEGMKIVQVSDIHLGSWISKKHLDRAIDLVNSQDPDLIFVTGDLANYSTDDVVPFRNNLARLKAKEDIFVILGNHDYGDYTTWPSESAKVVSRQQLYNLYDSLNWILLLNENKVIKRGNDSIGIIGVHNWGMTRRFQRMGDIGKAEKSVDKMAVLLLLSHDPTHWDRIIRKSYPNIDVTFSGHTHAFQLGFTIFGKEYSPSVFFYPEWGGLYESPVINSHPCYLYVNRGLGTIGYPGRIGETPEITVFTLKK